MRVAKSRFLVGAVVGYGYVLLVLAVVLGAVYVERNTRDPAYCGNSGKSVHVGSFIGGGLGICLGIGGGSGSWSPA